MYYKTIGKNYYFNIQDDLVIKLDSDRYAINRVSKVDWVVSKRLYDLVEIPYEEYNNILQQILSTLKINKFNFQFNGKK
jgi:hypothetical protein